MHGPVEMAPSYLRPDGIHLSQNNFFLFASYGPERGEGFHQGILRLLYTSCGLVLGRLVSCR